MQQPFHISKKSRIPAVMHHDLSPGLSVRYQQLNSLRESQTHWLRASFSLQVKLFFGIQRIFIKALAQEPAEVWYLTVSPRGLLNSIVHNLELLLQNLQIIARNEKRTRKRKSSFILGFWSLLSDMKKHYKLTVPWTLSADCRHSSQGLPLQLPA